MRLLVGTFGPRVPYMTTRDGVNQGPAGSLAQARERAFALRCASRPPAGRDWRLWVGGGLAVLALLLLASGGVGGLVLGGLAAAVALALRYPRYRRGVLETKLGRQIGRERRVARELEPLRGLGCTVLHDRVLPDTEHRLAHVLAGPGGVLVVSVLPATGPLLCRDDALWTGGAPLTDWFAARWWEVNRLHAALARRLSRWPWAGPVYPVAVLPEDRVQRRAAVRGRVGSGAGRGDHPHRRPGPLLGGRAARPAGAPRGRGAGRRGGGRLPVGRGAGGGAGRVGAVEWARVSAGEVGDPPFPPLLARQLHCGRRQRPVERVGQLLQPRHQLALRRAVPG
jgi:hypothetical protein